MKSFSACAAVLVASMSVAQTPATPGAAPAMTPEQMSYLFGLTFGTQLRNFGVAQDVSIDTVTRGIDEALKGRAPTDGEMRDLRAHIAGVAQAAVARNQQAAADFLARNAKQKGVITTASGLQFKILDGGNKKAPAIKAADDVTVQYRGRLLDGTEFDSSYARGEPATFPVTGVIKGWQEALVLMKPGAKWQLWIPPALGYGAVAKPNIPAGSLLVFDVNLIAAKTLAPVEPATQAPPSVPPGTPSWLQPGSH